MTKRNNPKSKSSKQYLPKYSFTESEMRPVTEKDKWCLRRDFPPNVPIPHPKWGYVLTIPFIPNQLQTCLEGVDGYIIRSKLHCRKLLLQVIPKRYAPAYGITSVPVQHPKIKGKKFNKKNLARILNVRNLRKCNSNW